MGGQRTDAESSGVSIEPHRLKALASRRDGPAFIYLAANLALLAGSGYLLHLSLASLWAAPAMLAYGSTLATAAYALSHEALHRTAFKTRWLNDALFFLTSLVYVEEPTYRRFAHTRHHNHTWIRGQDPQIPWELPMSVRGYLYEVSGLAHYAQEAGLLVRHSVGSFDDEVRRFAPASKLPKLKRGARIFLSVYAATAVLIASGETWLLVYLVLPRIVGAPFMTWITLIQHAEMHPDSPDIRASSRSFETNRLVRLVYWNMNHHIEHHLYPAVPFHALPALRDELQGQLPDPDPGVLMTNVEVARAVLAREMGDVPRELSPRLSRATRALIQGRSWIPDSRTACTARST